MHFCKKMWMRLLYRAKIGKKRWAQLMKPECTVCVGWLVLSYEIMFGGCLVKRDWAGGPWFQNVLHFHQAKNTTFNLRGQQENKKMSALFQKLSTLFRHRMDRLTLVWAYAVSLLLIIIKIKLLDNNCVTACAIPLNETTRDQQSHSY